MTDLFAGAGGFFTGARLTGVEVAAEAHEDPR